MLRLEKTAKTGEINVRLRKRDRFFSSAFCLAFGVALFLHLLAILLFQIHPFIVESQWLFPSIKVNSELEIQHLDSEAFVLAEMEENKLLTPTFNPPAGSMPELPKIPEVYLTHQLEPIPEKRLPPQKIFSAETNTLPVVHFSPKFSFSFDSFAISAYGRLGEKAIVSQAKPEQITLQLFTLQKMRARYLVRVEEKTGTIFWAERLESTKMPDLDRQAERIINTLCFQQDHTHLETLGEVEITFFVP